MKTPGVGNKKRKFKQLLGWGKNERTRLKQPTQGRARLSRKLRSQRTKPNKSKLSNSIRRKSRRKRRERITLDWCGHIHDGYIYL